VKSSTSFQEQCKGKKKYNFMNAVNALIELEKKFGGNPPLDYYKCSYCNRWHVGRLSNKQIQERREQDAKNSSNRPM
jgi:hypothetical protein